METLPCSHFWNGGIVVDQLCHTTVPNLLAGGEGIAGIHGANRISGNGLAQAIVWGIRAGQTAAEEVKREAKSHREIKPTGLCTAETHISEMLQASRSKEAPTPVKFAQDIREATWRGIGLVRSESGMREFSRKLSDMASTISKQCLRSAEPVWNEDLILALQNANMLDVAQMIVTAALVRKESRGAHYRSDFPFTDEVWDVNIRIQMREGVPVYEATTAKNSVARQSFHKKTEEAAYCKSSKRFKYGCKERTTSEDPSHRP
jgi:fumarate reductase (CoM/CoB) subunit A